MFIDTETTCQNKCIIGIIIFIIFMNMSRMYFNRSFYIVYFN